MARLARRVGLWLGGGLLGMGLGGCVASSPLASKPVDPPRLDLPVPATAEQRVYLGLPEGADSFLIDQVKAEVLVIDCFDLYCPSCQKGAKYVNRLYELIEDRGLGGRVKLIGLGLGNTPMEVDTFRDKYAIRFPVFPDRSNAVARQYGEARVPGLIVIRPGPETRVLHREPGVVRDPERLLEHLLDDLREGTVLPLSSGSLPTTEVCDAEECPAPILDRPQSLPD